MWITFQVCVSKIYPKATQIYVIIVCPLLALQRKRIAYIVIFFCRVNAAFDTSKINTKCQVLCEELVPLFL